ncbi:MAG: YerC/YecD family TrpR-related protein [Candidatus Roizmanbacteria bacterium]|nr:YerC/YecD family TrpR-related protein [Candidatus Roizmanbacteria bacterium]
MKKQNWIRPDTNKLFDAILLLRTRREAQCFFRDLLTENEIAEFANRWKVARMLSKKRSYTVIAQQTGMSSTTIARISKWLSKGMNGYLLLLNRISHTHHESLPSLEDSS